MLDGRPTWRTLFSVSGSAGSSRTNVLSKFRSCVSVLCLSAQWQRSTGLSGCAPVPAEDERKWNQTHTLSDLSKRSAGCASAAAEQMGPNSGRRSQPVQACLATLLPHRMATPQRRLAHHRCCCCSTADRQVPRGSGEGYIYDHQSLCHSSSHSRCLKRRALKFAETVPRRMRPTAPAAAVLRAAPPRGARGCASTGSLVTLQQQQSQHNSACCLCLGLAVRRAAGGRVCAVFVRASPCLCSCVCVCVCVSALRLVCCAS